MGREHSVLSSVTGFLAQDLSLPLLLQTFVAMEGGHGQPPRMNFVTRNTVTVFLNPPCDASPSLWCLSC